MRIKRREGLENSGAFSDLAFLLIIYFIVIAGFNVNRGFLVGLPRKDSVKTVKREELLKFELDQGGNVYFQGRVMDRAGAEAEIRRALSAAPNLALLLTAAPGAPWQGVVSFVELAQALEVENFSFTMGTENTLGKESLSRAEGGDPP
ncbi:MAG: biopolymer transporter ExbD [Treponema sp.]|jgi:biopolymer transport protein ExbD|nr:biopolymer transporter ExbD [Treponema sp.]